MEFKKHYIFMDSILYIIILGILLVGDIVALSFVIIWYGNEKFSGEIAGIIFCIICAVGLLLLILMVFSFVTIDEKKIELKKLLGNKLSFCISDIYKIEKKHGPKGISVFVIYGNSPKTNFDKIETITLMADENREKILRHFISNSKVWIADT